MMICSSFIILIAVGDKIVLSVAHDNVTFVNSDVIH